MVALAVLAVAVVAATMADLFDTVAPALGLLVPIVVALIVRARADWKVKQLVAVVITAGLAVASIALEDWSMFSWGLLTERAFMVLGQAQATYFLVSAAVERWSSTAESINDLEVFRPESGVG